LGYLNSQHPHGAPNEIGTVTGCQREIGDVFGTPILFNVDCDNLPMDGQTSRPSVKARAFIARAFISARSPVRMRTPENIAAKSRLVEFTQLGGKGLSAGRRGISRSDHPPSTQIWRETLIGPTS
jgi:hypothetical protein